MTFEDKVRLVKEARQHIAVATKGLYWAWNAAIAVGLKEAKETEWFMDAKLRLAELDGELEDWLKDATKTAALPLVPEAL